ncbi:hypothetical protein CISIN_1g032762mg [Citrus sinensis]|uniref:Glycine-rich protein n=1 Tax=Citrus sinensis TaxID=2711 RepID=A0A067F4R8_CITSI|nr:hypothetical protein CISIN_1g032762mg [Citrus sinensis]
MGSKVFLMLGLLVSIVLLISSEAAARDLAETSNDDQKNGEVAGETNGVDDAKYNGGYGGYPGGGRGYPGRGGYGGGGRGHGGGYCRYGCCGRGYYGRGCRCCSYAGEAVNAQTEAEPQN